MMMTNNPQPAQRSAAEKTTMSARQVRRRYLAAGAVLGGLWYAGRNMPLWEHALQMLIVMTVVTVLQVILRRRHGGPPKPASAYVRLVGVKVALIALAVGASWSLSQWTSRANTIVAVGLVVLVAMLGPALDGRAAPDAARPRGRS
jgi:hypothetical protein